MIVLLPECLRDKVYSGFDRFRFEEVFLPLERNDSLYN